MINKKEYLILALVWIIFSVTFNIVYTIINTTKQIAEVKDEPLPGITLNLKAYRLTHYYTNDPDGSGTCTASGLCTDKFSINNRGWYTYLGYLVVAAAPKDYLIYDTIYLFIDGEAYNAIVLDKCGACAKDTARIDLFVSNKESGIDRGYKGINPVYISQTY